MKAKPSVVGSIQPVSSSRTLSPAQTALSASTAQTARRDGQLRVPNNRTPADQTSRTRPTVRGRAPGKNGSEACGEREGQDAESAGVAGSHNIKRQTE